MAQVDDPTSSGKSGGTRRTKPLLRDRVTVEIRQLILDGELKPGVLLREEHLASMLGVSRGPVREAIIELEREGLAQRRAGRSSFVVELTPRDLEEVLTLRRAQEAVAIQFAIRGASDFELLELERIGEVHAAACEAQESNEVRSKLDIDFHDYLYRVARHTRLYETWMMIRMQVFLFLRMRDSSNWTSEDYLRPVGFHRELVQSLKARDMARAIAAADDHLIQGYAAGIESMPQWWLQDNATLLPPPPAVGN